MNSQNRQFYGFDGYRIEPEERLLRRDTEVVHLPPKAVDLLLVLLENHGRVVSKEDLLASVWPDSIVEEANLSHNIFLLRKALDEKTGKFIETVPKRGYRFVAEVSESSEGAQSVFVGEQTVTRFLVEEEIETDGFQVQSLKPKDQGQQPAKLRLWTAGSGLRTRPIVFVIAFLAVVCAGVAGFFYFNRETAQPVVKAAPRFMRLTNSEKMLASTISPDGKFVAYGQNYTTGDGSLYIRQVDTNKEMRLVEPAERFFGTTAFSPDGAFVFFIEHKKGVEQGALYRVSALGGQPTKLLDGVNLMFGLSPDGQSAVFVRHDREKRENSLVIARFDGSGENVALTRGYDELHFSYCPAWSPDGRFIAFGAIEKNNSLKENEPSTKMFTLELATGTVNKISDDRWHGIGKLNWLADGSGLVFPANLSPIGNHIYFLSYPRGESRRLTNELNNFGNYGLGISADGTTLVADIWETSYQLWATGGLGGASMDKAEQLSFGTNDGEYGITTLPDGSVIYASSSGDTTDLWKVTDGKAESLTTDEFTEFDVSAAPDGNFLAFGSNRAGSSHIFRMEMSDLSLRQLTFGEGFDSKPDISPDGNWIVYNSGSTVSKMPSSGGSSVQLTDYTAIAPVFSPDGEMISCILPNDKVTENARLAIISSADGNLVKEFAIVPFSWHHRGSRWTPDGKAVTFRIIEKSATNLWKQDLSGGKPTLMTDFKSDYISNYVFSRDGKLIAARGRFVGGVALIRNFK